MITLAHRHASGALDDIWELDPLRRLVMCVHRGQAFDVPVAYDQEKLRKPGAYVLTRLSEDVWRIAPSRIVLRRRKWDTEPCAYPESHVIEFITLTHAPALVQNELEAL